LDFDPIKVVDDIIAGFKAVMMEVMVFANFRIRVGFVAASSYPRSGVEHMTLV
jgi:hypothetical protein